MPLLLIVFLLLLVTAFLVARKVYLVLTSRQNKFAMLISILSFILVCVLLGTVFFIIVIYSMDFGR